MRNRQRDSMFQYFIRGLDQKTQLTLSQMYSNSQRWDDFIHRREMEEMKKEITEDVMARISIRIEDEALKQLRDMLNDLGNQGGTICLR